MGRIYFFRAKNGYRAVRGEVISRVQNALKTAGSDPKNIDGIYGGDTESALRDFQNKRNLEVNGLLSVQIWTALTGESIPDLLSRCLQLTGDFEGHGFQKVAGNFDGAGLTWGIIGFTLQHGEVQNILKTIQQKYPDLLGQAFGNLRDNLRTMLNMNLNDQIKWADSISVGSNKYQVAPMWEQAFKVLGSFAEVKAVQMERVKKYWDIALNDARRFGLKSETGLALCFDIAVQNGGIDTDAEERRIMMSRNTTPLPTERDLCVLIANTVAENSRPQYIEDVRKRKLTIATGDGIVHGVRYSTKDWGIGEYPWQI